MKTKPIGHNQMQRLIWYGQMDGMDWDVRTNSRQAICKVCGDPIPKGKGAYWRRFGPNNQIRFTVNYLCPDCQEIWGNVVYKTVTGKWGGDPGIRPVPASWNDEKIKEVLGYVVKHK